MGTVVRWGWVVALVAGMLRPVEAARLFQSGPPGMHVRSALTGVGGVRLLTVDRDALAALRAADHAELEDFPLGDARSAAVELDRFEPFAAGARIEVMTPTGPQAMAPLDRRYFSGRVRGEPSSRVFVVAGPTGVQGFVASAGDVYPFGPDGHGRHRSYALTKADTTQYPPPRDFCANDLEPEAIEHPPAPHVAHEVAADLAPPVAAVPGTLRIADLAIETDNELRNKFASDQAELDYLSSLLAAATAIYERDVNVRLQYSYLRLWGTGTTDPWTSTTPSGELSEVRAYWNNAANNMDATAGPHDVVHFLSGKSVQGGVAYVDVLCLSSWAYGVSQVYGSFDLSNPYAVWDLVVFTHELGHNFGSPHSHCYNPPLDQCYNAEPGCYAGPVVQSHGTLMSYCHLLGNGLANIDLSFGDTISTRIRTSVDAAACLATTSTTTTSTPGSTTTTASTTTTTRPTTTTTRSTTTATVTTTTRPASTTTTVAGTTTTGAPGTTVPASTTTTAAQTTSTTDVPTTTVDASTTTTDVATTLTVTTTLGSTTTLAAVDGDDDGVPDARDLCIGTAPDEPVDPAGCSLCPCSGPRSGGAWRSHAQYVRCVRSAVVARAAAAIAGRASTRAALRHAQVSTCGRSTTTRCCVDGPVAGVASCQIMRTASCALKVASGGATDAGDGSCSPFPCEGRSRRGRSPR